MDKRQIFALAATLGVAVGVALASSSRRRNQRDARHAQHRLDLKAWENEGGNLAPPARSVATGNLA